MIWNTKITLDLHGQQKDTQTKVGVKISALNGLVKLKLKPPSHKKSSDKMNSSVDGAIKFQYNFDTTIDVAKWVLVWLRKLMFHIECTKWNWHTTIGTGDPVSVAITSGIIWGIKGSLLGLASQYMRLTGKPIMQVQPLYNVEFFNSEWSCVLKLKLGQALVAAVVVQIRLRMNKKQDKKQRKASRARSYV